MLNSLIDPATLKAYEETNYHVYGDEPFTLRIGQFASVLAAAHQERHVNCSAFITAFNPFSAPQSDLENANRHALLGQELTAQGLFFIEGVGQHPSNEWLGEASYLVYGLTLEASKSLGKRFEQNAIVWSGADATPGLITLR